MPTARPIIVARIEVLLEMSTRAVMAVTPVRPMPTPIRAVMIGSPAATRDPKVRISTSRATPMPRASEARPGVAKPVAPGPLASTTRPWSRASSITSSRASSVSGSTSAGLSTSQV